MIESNEGFTCKNKKCRKKVLPHTGGSCRNHCPYCLYSMHVDLDVPGDRLSECKGMMVPVTVEMNKKKGARILHVCEKCGFKTYNRVAPDDNWEKICELSRVPLEIEPAKPLPTWLKRQRRVKERYLAKKTGQAPRRKGKKR
ncbi:RNHCP domain-containing protein [Candidatus Peregrinibacteria bacterium]|nr:RNHCP domain-containing protein [Candidatus Peregrinibacteria bacterium]